MTSPYFLESVARVMRVLDCFTLETPELRLVDLVGKLNMHKTQVLRIVSTLESGGYLIRDSDTKRYRLGLQLFHLGMVASHGINLREVVHPYLLHLVQVTEETARLVVVDQERPVCIDVVESPHGVRVYAQLGARMPWHAGSSGPLILAYLPEERREAILTTGGFERFNQHTITDPGALRQRVEAARRAGYLFSAGDLTTGARGVAAPLFNHRGEILGAITVAAPENRLTDDEVERFTRLVREAAASASEALGCPPSLRALASAT
jgi:DNA-binding IclR family transcriptional regulator